MTPKIFHLEEHELFWTIRCADLELRISRATGCVCETAVLQGGRKSWSAYEGDVTVRDDVLERTFSRKHLEKACYESSEEQLIIRKTFRGAPWLLEECYHADSNDLCWESRVVLNSGEYRSCAVEWHLPWPQPVFPVHFWASRPNMPSQVCNHAGLALEYGEITSGIILPMISCYRPDLNAGLALTMPFDFRTPRFRFILGFREPELRVSFDWMALFPGHPASAKLLLRGTPGDWRPALGWVYDRYREYFEPSSSTIGDLWGGHISGRYTLSEEDAVTMSELGIRWYEIHGHFPAYGNYHPEGMKTWRSGHYRKDDTMISEQMIHDTIRTLHDHGIAAFPYLQVSGDGDQKMLSPEMSSSRITNRRGNNWVPWEGTFMMNSSPDLPFGKDICRQIDGITARYPEIDGIFLDQACYNFIDTSHNDGMTAVDNQPAYMIGYNYLPHLNHLSRLLHPRKSIIANGPFGIGIMKYLDGIMAEGEGWLCELLQYYTLGTKPMFFLMYEYDEVHIELMFQRALQYGAGFASYPSAAPSKYLFDQYQPLLKKLYRRHWVFEPDPIHLPTGFAGNIFRGENGSLYISLIQTISRNQNRKVLTDTVTVTMPETDRIRRCILHRPGQESGNLDFTRDENGFHFQIPVLMSAGLAELAFS